MRMKPPLRLLFIWRLQHPQGRSLSAGYTLIQERHLPGGWPRPCGPGARQSPSEIPGYKSNSSNVHLCPSVM